MFEIVRRKFVRKQRLDGRVTSVTKVELKAEIDLAFKVARNAPYPEIGREFDLEYLEPRS